MHQQWGGGHDHSLCRLCLQGHLPISSLATSQRKYKCWRAAPASCSQASILCLTLCTLVDNQDPMSAILSMPMQAGVVHCPFCPYFDQGLALHATLWPSRQCTPTAARTHRHQEGPVRGPQACNASCIKQLCDYAHKHIPCSIGRMAHHHL